MSGLEGLTANALSWAVTYAIHSSLLLGLAVILTRWLVRGDLSREIVWKGALLGSVLTATVATALPLEPLAGRVTVPPTGTARAPGILSAPAAMNGEAGSDIAQDAAPGAATAATEPFSPPAAGRESAQRSWTSILLLAWAVTASGLLGILLYRNVRLFRHVRGRRRLTEGPLVATLAELRRRAGIWRPVAISVADECPTPLVIGASEICLPPRFLTDLDEAQQRAALAHELAHVRRRDPLWQLATAALNAVLFFQPLNVLARRRLREASEHLCDDWAVRLTGAPLALGQCLATVASWTAARPIPALQVTHAVAEGGSPLVHRIRRIAEGVSGTRELRMPALISVSLLVLATAVGAPAASRVSPGASPSGTAGPPDDTTPASSAPSVAANDTLETVRLLERFAMEHPSPRIRQEAAAELSDFQHPDAAAALMRIARRASDPEVRAEAAQQLDEFPTDEVVAVLLDIVFEDSVDGVRSNALDVLDDFALASARDALARLAREHPLPEIRQAAVAALADGV